MTIMGSLIPFPLSSVFRRFFFARFSAFVAINKIHFSLVILSSDDCPLKMSSRGNKRSPKQRVRGETENIQLQSLSLALDEAASNRHQFLLDLYIELNLESIQNHTCEETRKNEQQKMCACFMENYVVGNNNERLHAKL